MEGTYHMNRRREVCLECGQPLDYMTGRQDRKFCSLECKNRYHNAGRTVVTRRYREKILKILENNNCILKKLLSMGVRTLDIPALRQMNFNFDFSTSYHKQGCRQVFACFEIQYELTPTRMVNIRNLLDQA